MDELDWSFMLNSTTGSTSELANSSTEEDNSFYALLHQGGKEGRKNQKRVAEKCRRSRIKSGLQRLSNLIINHDETGAELPQEEILARSVDLIRNLTDTKKANEERINMLETALGIDTTNNVIEKSQPSTKKQSFETSSPVRRPLTLHGNKIILPKDTSTPNRKLKRKTSIIWRPF